jgi:hypothetical protein
MKMTDRRIAMGTEKPKNKPIHQDILAPAVFFHWGRFDGKFVMNASW